MAGCSDSGVLCAHHSRSRGVGELGSKAPSESPCLAFSPSTVSGSTKGRLLTAQLQVETSMLHLTIAPDPALWLEVGLLGFKIREALPSGVI